MEAVSLIIFYSSTTLLSVMITESTGTVHAYEPELQLGKRFPAMISKSAATHFSVMIIESTGIITESTRTVRAYVSKHQLWKRFR